MLSESVVNFESKKNFVHVLYSEMLFNIIRYILPKITKTECKNFKILHENHFAKIVYISIHRERTLKPFHPNRKPLHPYSSV